MGVDPRDAGTDRGLREPIPSSVDDRTALGGSLSPLDLRPYPRPHGGPEELVLSRQAADKRISFSGLHHGPALLIC